MKFIDEFRDKPLCDILIREIHREAKFPVTIMEVCGGHTMALHRFGIPSLLPESIRLLSGPGCPVCVTGRGTIDNAVSLAQTDNVIVCTYGDLMRVPGTVMSIEGAKASGGAVEVVWSPMQCLEMAMADPGSRYVFLGIGFEATAPASAVVLQKAKQLNCGNFFLYSAHKLMPPAMAAIIHEGIGVDGYLCPGHVSTVTGTAMYAPLVESFGVGCVIAGFEPLDLLQSILMLVQQHNSRKPAVEIQYTRAVRPGGNPKARQFVEEVFEPADAWWRGLGVLPGSGLKIRDAYRAWDAQLAFSLSLSEPVDPKGCSCGEVLKGLVNPTECPLFGNLCTPEDPVGACMVSAEGACQTYYRYATRE